MSLAPAIPENPGPIIGAGTRDIGQGCSTLPNMGTAILGWFRPLQMVIIATTIVAGLAHQVERTVNTSGVLQPMKSRQVMLKPEGDRAFRWYTLHAAPGLQLKRNDIIVIRGITYRVMGEWDWSDSGYLEYELIEAPSQRDT